jgi:polyphosphate kinase
VHVRSIVGRFLEHSRAMSFQGGGTPEWWIGSSDLMHRNLDRRVEVLLRVNDPVVQRCLQRVFDDALAPDVRSWHLSPDGSWTRSGTRDHQADLLADRGEHAG